MFNQIILHVKLLKADKQDNRQIRKASLVNILIKGIFAYYLMVKQMLEKGHSLTQKARTFKLEDEQIFDPNLRRMRRLPLPCWDRLHSLQEQIIGRGTPSRDRRRNSSSLTLVHYQAVAARQAKRTSSRRLPPSTHQPRERRRRGMQPVSGLRRTAINFDFKQALGRSGPVWSELRDLTR